MTDDDKALLERLLERNGYNDSLMEEAADRIEAQAQQIDTLTKAHDLWCEKTEWVQTTAQKQELGLHRADVLRLRIETLSAEVERLREALKPFAKAGEIAGEPSPYGDWYAYRPAAGDEYAIFGQHLRDARAALGEKQ